MRYPDKLHAEWQSREAPREGFLSANGLRYHYLEWGEAVAPALLLLHGSTTTAYSWLDIGPVLARSFRVIAYDMRNHGESDSAAFGSRDALAGDLAGIVDALGLATFGLVGHSAGGGAAMVYAVRHPERLTTLVLEDIGPVSPPAAAARAQSGRSPTPAAFESLEQLCAWMRKIRPHASGAWLEQQARHLARPLPDGRWVAKHRPVLPSSDALPNLDLWPLLSRVACPTLILRASESTILPASDAARMVQVMPNAREVVVPRAGHMAHEDNGPFVVEALSEFFGIA